MEGVVSLELFLKAMRCMLFSLLVGFLWSFMLSADFSFLLRGKVAYFSIVLASIGDILDLDVSIWAFKDLDMSGAGLLLIEGHLPSSVGVEEGVRVPETLRVEVDFFASFFAKVRSRLLGAAFVRKLLSFGLGGAFPCSLSMDLSLAGPAVALGLVGGLALDLSFAVVPLVLASDTDTFFFVPIFYIMEMRYEIKLDSIVQVIYK